MNVIELKKSNLKNKYYSKNFKRCIGTGRLGLALRKDYLDALQLIQKEIGFEYIRGHGLFSDDIGIYREYVWQGEERILYNFTNIDKIMDAYIELNLKPFLELGFMPKDLASGTQTVFWWKGNVTPPRDYKKWVALVRATLEHFIDRYGIDEVLQWPIEIWNEPNLTNFWQNADQEEYFKLYEVTVREIKKIHAEFQVGGPAICGGGESWIIDFVKHCKRNNIPLDFLSRHSYSSQQPEIRPFTYYQKLSSVDNILDDFASVNQMVEQLGYAKMPVHITEYNTSYNPTNPIHDTVYNATYLAKVLSQGGDYVDSFSYWTFSDVFEESNTGVSLFHGGFGLLGFHEIKKPTYFLFEFFSKLVNGMELYRDENSHIVYMEKAKKLIGVLWNLDSEEKRVEIDFSDFFMDDEVLCVIRKINEECGNPREMWKKLGGLRYPSQEDIQLIKETSLPKILVERTQKKRTVILSKNEFCLIEFTAVPVEKQEYIGLDDHLIY